MTIEISGNLFVKSFESYQTFKYSIPFLKNNNILINKYSLQIIIIIYKDIILI